MINNTSLLRRTAVGSLLVTLVLAGAACSSGSRPSVTAQPASAVDSGNSTAGPFVGLNAPPPGPAPSAKAALTVVLTSEEHGDHAASFVLLSDQARTTYKDIPRWTDRRNEVAVVTGFQLQGGGSASDTATQKSLVATVEHTPGLDPFRGLSPAQDRETWTARLEHGGWVVDADPATTLLLPSDTTAPAAALAWVRAEAACDTATASAHQADNPLLGVATAPTQLCGHKASFSAGPPHSAGNGPAAQDLVAQYSSDSLGWARGVTVTGADHPFEVVLAPIGDEWKVVGIYTGV